MSLYDKASIALIPSGVKSTKLYSVLPANGNGDFTHSRGSTATRINKDGLIESAASGVPRLDYPLTSGVVGDCPNLLLEPSRTNIALYSEDFTNAAWIKQRTTITGNQAVSPDGSVTADKVTGTGTGASYFYDGFSVSSGTVYTISIFAKKINVDNFYINNFSQAGSITFDLSDGTIDTSASGTFSNGKIENYGNDWYRLSVQYTASATASVNIGFYGQNYSGDGAFAWGAQIETGSYVTSYIPNLSTGSTTRSLDASKDSGSASLINSEEGVLFAEIAHLNNGDDHRRITLSDGSASNVVRISYDSTTNEITALLYNGSNQCVFSTTSFDITNLNKVALQYKANEFKCFVNGSQLGSTDTSGTTFSAGTLTELAFDNGGGGNLFVGKCKQLIVFNETLTDAELTTLTTQ
tara:strand:+ start:3824 stop:5053 length:1230 start_codon:yes stop_codon:yes gene_type:complete